jgi:hypothetical protein
VSIFFKHASNPSSFDIGTEQEPLDSVVLVNAHVVQQRLVVCHITRSSAMVEMMHSHVMEY